MAASLTIGGVEYISWLQRGSLQHLDDLTSNPDTLSFTLVFSNGAGVALTAPPAGAEVIYIKSDGTRIFGGVLGQPEEVKQGFLKVGYACHCTDYRVWADRKILNDRLINQKAGAMVVQLFKKYAPEFDTSLVNTTDGPTITSIRFKRSDRLTGALDRLSKQAGFFWDVTPQKKVLFGLVGSVVAPFGLSDGSKNFSDLAIRINRDQLRNRITIKGAFYPASQATVDYFSGDGLTTAFRLTQTPYGLDQYQVFAEAWASFNTLTWVKTDVNNPSPPPGHIGADGYIFTTTQQGTALAESGKLQIVGGSSVWGASRVASLTPQLRDVAGGTGNRRFEFDVYADAGGSMRVGLWDPNVTGTLLGEQHGVIFSAGTLLPSEGGTAQAPITPTSYTLGRSVRVRIVPKQTTGAVTWVNTDDTNGFRASQWVKLYDSNVGSLASFAIVPAFDFNFVGRVGRVKVLNKLYGVTVTVGGVAQVVGLLNIDNDGGLDAAMGLQAGEAPSLVFFSDRTPAAGSQNIVATYFQQIPILVQNQDVASIAAVKLIENPSNLPTGSDGIYDGYLEDNTLDSLELAQRRSTIELGAYANPQVTLTFTTYTAGLAAGQVLTVNLTSALSGRTLAGSYLIQSVETVSLGSGVYAYNVMAGSRLLGLHEYLIELLMAGKALSATQDDNAPIDQTTSAVDLLGFAETNSVTNGPLGPYNYGTALYGQSTYA